MCFFFFFKFSAWLFFSGIYNIFLILYYLWRRTSPTWQRSCLKKAQRRAATIFLTPKAEKTTAASSVKRAGEDGGCEEVTCAAYSTSISKSPVYVGCTDVIYERDGGRFRVARSGQSWIPNLHSLNIKNPENTRFTYIFMHPRSSFVSNIKSLRASSLLQNRTGRTHVQQ